MNQEESNFIDQIKQGGEGAFEQLFHLYYKVLTVYGKKLLGDLDLAKEIVQDVFVKFYENREEIQIDSSIKNYLFRAVHNACLNQVKKAKIHDSHHQEIKYNAPFYDNADLLIQTELEENIWKAIEKLPDQCLRIFKLSRFEGKKNKEIAEELCLSIRTVETQISKALRSIRTDIKDLLILILLISASL